MSNELSLIITQSPSSKKIIFFVNGAKATESEPINVALSEIPIARGLPLLAPASNLRSLKITAIAKAPSNFASVFLQQLQAPQLLILSQASVRSLHCRFAI